MEGSRLDGSSIVTMQSIMNSHTLLRLGDAATSKISLFIKFILHEKHDTHAHKGIYKKVPLLRTCLSQTP